MERNVRHPIQEAFHRTFLWYLRCNCLKITQTPKTAAAMEYEIADLYQFRQSATGALTKRLATDNKTRGEPIMFATPC